MQHPTASSSTNPKTRSFSMPECITRCLDCFRACEETAARCLEKSGAHAQADHVRLLVDCAEICRTSAAFMMRGSDHHHLTCGACAEICEVCAIACEAMPDDVDMKRCAETCRRCAESCKAMASH